MVIAAQVPSGELSPDGLAYDFKSKIDELINAANAFTALTATEWGYLASSVAGTITASKAVVVNSGKAVNEWTVTAGDLNVSKSITSATPATERLTRSELTLNPSTTLAVGSSGSLAGVRGCVTLNSGKSITDGFLYGVQGKFVGDGATIAVGSGHVAGVLAQMSGASMVATSGHIGVLVVSGQSLPASANVNMIYVESGGNKVHSVLESNVAADYLFSVNNFESCGIVAAAGTGATSAGVSTGGVATRVFKVIVDGVAAYIPLFVSNA